MKKNVRAMMSVLLFLGVACAPVFAAEGAAPRIFLAGDSTVASYGPKQSPQAGWGQMLPLLFTNTVAIKNFAVGGATTRSFAESGRWKKICDQLEPGDYVFVQFGHNDQYARGTNFVDLESYGNNLTRFVGDVIRAKAVPVLVVPPNSGDFNGAKVADLHKKYAVMVRKMASATGVCCVDLQARSMALFEKLGREETLKDLFMWFPADVFTNYPEGKKDTWHFSENGATRMAELLAEELQNMHSPLAPYLLLQNFSQASAMDMVERTEKTGTEKATLPVNAGLITPVSEQVPCAIADRQDFQIPDRVQLTGWLGTRITANEANRLAKLDVNRLLEGYRHRPGRQSWDGEHVGKWLHAATLAWVNTGDPALRAKLDETAAELCKCQLEDGYLGTYTQARRWTEWDVWAHKYNLIGLVTYMRYTGNRAPLPTCERMADLLCKTFGESLGQRDIVSPAVGNHMGMASTSVLEPMVLLYRFTGEKRYLDFCNYILRAWEQPDGPHIVSRLLDHQGVNKVGNGKAYEMLSCLNGALELYRTTGSTNLFNACLNAWQDIVAHRLYITGAASAREHFHDDFDLPNNDNVGETCVTVTWLQFNAQLLRLTGEARFAEQLEHVALNQLLGAQKPDGTAWGYYVQMEGKKPYSATLDGHCCLSSGPRGIALLPTFAITTDNDGAVVNLYDAGAAQLTLHDGTPVSLKTETLYPANGRIRITVEPAAQKEFSIKLRLPAWCQDYSLKLSGAKLGADGYLTLRRTWKSGDVVELNLKLSPRVVVGDHLNQGKVAVCYGPLVLAADEALLPATQPLLSMLALSKPDSSALAITPEAAPAGRRTWPGAEIFQVNATTRRGDTPFTASLIPFADAGATGVRYKVWLPVAGQPDSNVLIGGVESRSRQGNVTGSINDDDGQSFVTTFDGQPAAEDWFAVSLSQPVTIRRVVFVSGQIFHDGGWFDSTTGKPRVQIQRTPGSSWETIGELADYPATTATNSQGMRWGSNHFILKLTSPRTFVAIRVIGVPASGDNPKQAFSSCAELQAFEN